MYRTEDVLQVFKGYEYVKCWHSSGYKSLPNQIVPHDDVSLSTVS